MKKLLAIEGMTCEHCQARVEKALNGIEGVQAKVNLKHKEATVTLSRDVPDEEFSKVVEDAGYKLVSVKEKKGLGG